MKVVILTQGVSRIVEPLLQSRHQIVGIIENASRIRRYGWKGKLYDLGMSLYKINSGRPVSLKKLAARCQIPYYYMDGGCDSRLAAWLKNINPDIMVVYSMSELLRKNIFTVPNLGTINLHGSWLPEYRGPEPWLWMYYHMDLHPGTTVHFVDQGEDTGDIICQEHYELAPGTRLEELLDYGIGVVGIRLLLQALAAIEAGAVHRIPQVSDIRLARAANIEPEQFPGLIVCQSWPIERFCHFLRGSERWIDLIAPSGGLFDAYRWVVMEFIRCKMPAGYQIAKLYKENGRFFFACREGKIFLTKKFSFARLLANLTL